MDSFSVRMFFENKTVRLAAALGLALSACTTAGWTDDDITPPLAGPITPFSSDATANTTANMAPSESANEQAAVNPIERPSESNLPPGAELPQLAPPIRSTATREQAAPDSTAKPEQTSSTANEEKNNTSRRHWWQRRNNQPLTGNVDTSQLNGASQLTSLQPDGGPRHHHLFGLLGRNNNPSPFNGTPQRGMLGGLFHPTLFGLAATTAGGGVLSVLLHHDKRNNTAGLANVTTSGFNNNLVQDTSKTALNQLTGHPDSNHGLVQGHGAGLGLVHGHGAGLGNVITNNHGLGLGLVHGNNHGLLGLVHGHGNTNNTGLVSGLVHGSTTLGGHGTGLLQHGHGLAGGLVSGLSHGGHGIAAPIIQHGNPLSSGGKVFFPIYKKAASAGGMLAPVAHGGSCLAKNTGLIAGATKAVGHGAVSAAHVAGTGGKAVLGHGHV